MDVVCATSGPIAELGCGIYSTSFLHWWCFFSKRRLVTYESSPDFYEYAKAYATDFHEIHCVTDWDSVDLSHPWSVAFVDHGPDERRRIELARLRHAEYVVIHDTEPSNESKYRLADTLGLFQFRRDYMAMRRGTTVVSNFHNLDQLHHRRIVHASPTA
jgi:hypothetical protein